ncbi:ankyrin [Coprinellus micaceus]|uniref:Ankyrin n=1 Tax=Coprinellus micaceus TaxID=71717 RepID=A0A4Y7SY08_COPMI|nr:ankyrin [Coprinellus micaceus]
MPDLVKATFQNNQTALEVACQVKEWKLVSALVDAGANIDTPFQGGNDDIRVALHAACQYEAKEMVYFLLDKDADPNIVDDKWGWYAFPLAWAAARGDIDLVNRLLACGADPNLKGGFYGSALHACIRKGKDEVTRVLLEHGADPNTQSRFSLFLRDLWLI